MNIYIMRHGDAVLRAPTDAQRPLSPRGQQQVIAASRHLAGVKPDLLWVSPYLRAQETADGILDNVPWSLPKTIQEGIVPDAPYKSVIAALDALSGVETIVLVSHNPLVSALANGLVSGQPNGTVGFSTATVACLETPHVGLGLATLRWLEHTPMG